MVFSPQVTLKWCLISLGHPRFFLGSDSAPHPPSTKSTSTPTHACAAGVYTSPILLPLTAHLLESFGALDNLEGFVSTFGRKFYGREVADRADHSRQVRLRKVTGQRVTESWTANEESVVAFWTGKELDWEIVRG